MRVSLGTILLFFGAEMFAASPWQIIKVDGHDYLTVENVAKFYGFPPPKIDIGKIDINNGKDELEFTLGSREVMINGARNWLSFPVAQKDGKLLVSRMDLAKTIEPQLRPHMIPGVGKIKTVVLDPGHGGYDKGACSRYGCEKDYALDVARQLRPLLQAKGLRVLLTREGDYFVPLEVRARIANTAPDAIFVSIHFNATDYNDAANGLEIFSLTPLGAPSTHEDWVQVSALNDQNGTHVDAQSLELSSCIYHSMLGHIADVDRGIKRARFAVLRLTKVPAVLIEGGFMTETHEAQQIANKDYRTKLALAISMGIDNYRGLSDRKQQPLLVRDYAAAARKREQDELFPVDVKLQDPAIAEPTMTLW
jgi:N-acetylmuramoyl-L-alanine amidase